MKKEAMGEWRKEPGDRDPFWYEFTAEERQERAARRGRRRRQLRRLASWLLGLSELGQTTEDEFSEFAFSRYLRLGIWLAVLGPWLWRHWLLPWLELIPGF